MNRAEHLAWAKQRALEYVDVGDLPNALASITSDLTKHPETRGQQGPEVAMLELLAGQLRTPEEMGRCIEGFQ